MSVLVKRTIALDVLHSTHFPRGWRCRLNGVPHDRSGRLSNACSFYEKLAEIEGLALAEASARRLAMTLKRHSAHSPSNCAER